MLRRSGKIPTLVETVVGNLQLISRGYCSVGRSPAPLIRTIGNLTLSFSQKAMELFDETVDKMRAERPAIDQNYSSEYLLDELMKIVFSTKSLPARNFNMQLRSKVNNLVQRMQTNVTSWVFFVPIVNLEFRGFRKLAIGNVNFYRLTQQTSKYLLSLYKMRSHRNSFAKLLTDQIRVLAVAKVEAGEDNKAASKALLSVEMSLDILRLYNFVDEFGTQREISTFRGIENIHWKNLSTATSGSSLRALSTYPFMPFVFEKADLLKIRRTLRNFNRLLSANSPTRANSPTQLESKLFTSIHWYGLAVKDKMPVDRFVKLVVSLESLLLNANDEPKKHLLADRAAFIMGKTEATRKRIFEIATHAYSLRGKIVHEGLHDVSQKDVNTLLWLANELIFKLAKLTTTISSIEQISNLIRETKFGSKINKF